MSNEDNTALSSFLEPAREFAIDSYRLLKKCTKPDAKGERFACRLAPDARVCEAPSEAARSVLTQLRRVLARA
jgi:hypothetical protein